MRAADQRIQREDLPVHLVLVRVRRPGNTPVTAHVDRAFLCGCHSARLHQAAHLLRRRTQREGRAEGQAVRPWLFEPRWRLHTSPHDTQHEHNHDD